MVKIVECPNDLYSIQNEQSIKIFLGGGITNCEDWQSKLIDMISKEQFFNDKNITLYNPRRKNFDINNGIVLTTEIHRALHKKYGSSVSIEQLTEFKEEYQLTKTLNK